jgi:hypothetical protein
MPGRHASPGEKHRHRRRDRPIADGPHRSCTACTRTLYAASADPSRADSAKIARAIESLRSRSGRALERAPCSRRRTADAARNLRWPQHQISLFAFREGGSREAWLSLAG